LTSRSFAVSVGVVVAVLLLPFMIYNFLVDDFGLFWSHGPKRLWTVEKTSKYLMSFRYIPQNFDGLLVGPSFSDGLMDTRQLHGYRIYNLSMDGANATELGVATTNALKRGHFKFMIICLDPYLTKDSGIKGAQINVKEYWGSLFSLLPLKIMGAKLDHFRSGYVDDLAGSEWGSANLQRPVYTWDSFVSHELDDSVERQLVVDPASYRDLGQIVATAHQRGVRVLAYFFPHSIWRSQTAVASGAWGRYREQAMALFDPTRDFVWDMMGPQYLPLRSDPACYTDGHLSAAGARLVLADIQRTLDERFGAVQVAPVLPQSGSLACLGKLGAGSGYDRATVTGGVSAVVR
jgi:hypothetical protein